MPEMQRLHETHRQVKGWTRAQHLFVANIDINVYAFKMVAEIFMQVYPPPPPSITLHTPFQYASESPI